jgi:hypothetical protein
MLFSDPGLNLIGLTNLLESPTMICLMVLNLNTCLFFNVIVFWPKIIIIIKLNKISMNIIIVHLYNLFISLMVHWFYFSIFFKNNHHPNIIFFLILLFKPFKHNFFFLHDIHNFEIFFLKKKKYKKITHPNVLFRMFMFGNPVFQKQIQLVFAFFQKKNSNFSQFLFYFFKKIISQNSNFKIHTLNNNWILISKNWTSKRNAIFFFS